MDTFAGQLPKPSPLPLVPVPIPEGPDVINLKKHQQTHIQEVYTRMHTFGTCIDTSATGTGKTYVALKMIELLQRTNPELQTMVFCPGSVYNKWRETAFTFAGTDRRMVTGVVKTTAQGIHRALFDNERKVQETQHVTEVCNGVVFFKSRQVDAPRIKLPDANVPDFVIIDEMQKMKNDDAQVTGALLRALAHFRTIKPNLRILWVSATPIDHLFQAPHLVSMLSPYLSRKREDFAAPLAELNANAGILWSAMSGEHSPDAVDVIAIMKKQKLAKGLYMRNYTNLIQGYSNYCTTDGGLDTLARELALIPTISESAARDFATLKEAMGGSYDEATRRTWQPLLVTMLMLLESWLRLGGSLIDMLNYFNVLMSTLPVGMPSQNYTFIDEAGKEVVVTKMVRRLFVRNSTMSPEFAHLMMSTLYKDLAAKVKHRHDSFNIRMPLVAFSSPFRSPIANDVFANWGRVDGDAYPFYVGGRGAVEAWRGDTFMSEWLTYLSTHSHNLIDRMFVPQYQNLEMSKTVALVDTVLAILQDAAHTFKVAVYFNYLDSIREFVRILNERDPALADSVVQVYGDVIDTGRREKIDMFNAPDDRIRVLCGTTAIAEGIDLHDTTGRFPRVLFTMARDSAANQLQILGRIYRQDVRSHALNYIVYADYQQGGMLEMNAIKRALIRNIAISITGSDEVQTLLASESDFSNEDVLAQLSTLHGASDLEAEDGMAGPAQLVSGPTDIAEAPLNVRWYLRELMARYVATASPVLETLEAGRVPSSWPPISLATVQLQPFHSHVARDAFEAMVRATVNPADVFRTYVPGGDATFVNKIIDCVDRWELHLPTETKRFLGIV